MKNQSLSTLSLLVTILLLSEYGSDAFITPQQQQTLRSGGSDDFLKRKPTISTLSTATTPDQDEEVASSSSPYTDFDYNAHWYPVIWATDLRLNEPTKVTVFDVDYVVAKISDTEVIALENKCPHKAAALSEGRVTSSGNFQCAYHGWSFDARQEGKCVEIPQIVKDDGTMPPVVPSKSCAKAVPVQIHQEMVWLFPGGGLEEALVAPPPPSVREYDELGFKIVPTIREMPVDWPIVVSNICDPDHGLFAHQSKNFDMYSASKSNPLAVQEEFPNDGKGYVLKTQVDAGEKLLEIDRQLRGGKSKNHDETPYATSVLHMPNHLQLKRVDKETNTTNFVSAFYICPVGVGRTRFMSAALSKSKAPRWIFKLFLDNFLDQDTYLLATQQKYTLSHEAEEVRTMQESSRRSSSKALQRKAMKTRRNLFCLSTPTEKAGAKIEQFWDATLLRVPNRIPNLLRLDAAGAFIEAPSREYVLDRKWQQLDVSPDSQDVVANCEKVIRASKIVTYALIAAKLLANYWSKVPRRWNDILKPSLLLVTIGLSTLVKKLAEKMKKEYYFKYTDDMRRKDMSNIPKKIWIDK